MLLYLERNPFQNKNLVALKLIHLYDGKKERKVVLSGVELHMGVATNCHLRRVEVDIKRTSIFSRRLDMNTTSLFFRVSSRFSSTVACSYGFDARLSMRDLKREIIFQ